MDTVLTLNPNDEVGLIPNDFQHLTAEFASSFPTNTSVRITFDATNRDPLTGLPSETARF